MSSLLFYYTVFSETDEELKEWKDKFDEKVSQQHSLISKLERDRSDLENKIKILADSRTEIIIEISKLQSEAEVSWLFDKRNVPQDNLSYEKFLEVSYITYCPI